MKLIVQLSHFLLIVTGFLCANFYTVGQALVLPSPSSFKHGEGECADLGVAIANPNWRVRKGDVFAVSAVLHQQATEVSYTWKVANAKIISGQGSSTLQIKAGSQKTTGYINASGFISISLVVTKASSSGSCNVEANATVMIGKHRERNDFGEVRAVTFDEERLVRPCPPGRRPFEGQTVSKDAILSISTTAFDAENDVLTFAYSVSGGSIVGRGSRVDWDLSEVPEGTYTVVVSVDDGSGPLGKTMMKQIAVEDCAGCGLIECPTIAILGPESLEDESVFTANVIGGSQETVRYEWTVIGGEILEGQGTPFITVKIHTRAGGSVTIKISGTDPAAACITSESVGFDPYKPRT